MIAPWILFLYLILTFEFISSDYLEEREKLLYTEKMNGIGSNLILNSDEKNANQYLMWSKEREIEEGIKSPKNFIPSGYFYEKISKIHESSVFNFIKIIPKGGVLHLHDIGFTSLDWIIHNLTHWRDLYVNVEENNVNFQWSESQPVHPWTSVEEYRLKVSDSVADAVFLKVLNISSSAPFSNVNEAWKYFEINIEKMFQLLSYAPAYESYLYQGLHELFLDGVQYLEMRTVFPDNICQTLSCADTMNIMEVSRLTQTAFKRFENENPDFCGAKVIYAPPRRVNISSMGPTYIKNIKELRREFPDFVAGFDLVQQEDLGHPLLDFIDTLLQIREDEPDIKFFFHAGETLWSGVATDYNLADAVLLNATRIGHGYAILKHPEILKKAIEKKIAIEISPISNQMLGLVKDFRNHPGAILANQNSLPIVISNDDPAVWGAKGLSYDFYEAFMGFAPKDADLKFLKQLRLNSIEYSAMTQNEKVSCSLKIEKAWENTMKLFPIRDPRDIPSIYTN